MRYASSARRTWRSCVYFAENGDGSDAEFAATSPLDNQDERRMLLLIVRRSMTMSDQPSDLVQGTLDMLILKTLALEPIHGYGIAVRIEQMSKGVFHVNAGSLFVAVERLQRAGMIRSEWKTTENSRRAKYYALTEQGRKKLNSETREWNRQVAAIARILEAS
jgi:PadR family transcriptional regulator